MVGIYKIGDKEVSETEFNEKVYGRDSKQAEASRRKNKGTSASRYGYDKGTSKLVKKSGEVILTDKDGSVQELSKEQYRLKLVAEEKKKEAERKKNMQRIIVGFQEDENKNVSAVNVGKYLSDEQKREFSDLTSKYGRLNVNPDIQTKQYVDSKGRLVEETNVEVTYNDYPVQTKEVPINEKGAPASEPSEDVRALAQRRFEADDSLNRLEVGGFVFTRQSPESKKTTDTLLNVKGEIQADNNAPEVMSFKELVSPEKNPIAQYKKTFKFLGEAYDRAEYEFDVLKDKALFTQEQRSSREESSFGTGAILFGVGVVEGVKDTVQLGAKVVDYQMNPVKLGKDVFSVVKNPAVIEETAKGVGTSFVTNPSGFAGEVVGSYGVFKVGELGIKGASAVSGEVDAFVRNVNGRRILESSARSQATFEYNLAKESTGQTTIGGLNADSGKVIKKSPLGIDDYYNAQNKAYWRFDDAIATDTRVVGTGQQSLKSNYVKDEVFVYDFKTDSVLKKSRGEVVDLLEESLYSVGGKPVGKRFKVVGSEPKIIKREKFVDPDIDVSQQSKLDIFRLNKRGSATLRNPFQKNDVNYINPVFSRGASAEVSVGKEFITSPTLRGKLFPVGALQYDNKTDTFSGLERDNKVDVVSEPVQVQQPTTITSPVLRTKVFSSQKISQIQDTAPVQDVVQSRRTVTEPVPSEPVPVAENVNVLIKPVERTAKPFDLFEPKPVQPVPPVFSFPKPDTKRRAQVNQGFDVFVRERGVFKKASPFSFSKSDALDFGAFRVSTTARASFKLSPSVSPVSPLPSQFKGAFSLFGSNLKQKGGIFIEKKEKRIKSKGEKAEITLKGLMSLGKNKARF